MNVAKLSSRCGCEIGDFRNQRSPAIAVQINTTGIVHPNLPNTDQLFKAARNWLLPWAEGL